MSEGKWKRFFETVSTVGAIIEIIKLISILLVTLGVVDILSIFAINNFGWGEYSLPIQIALIGLALLVFIALYKKFSRLYPAHPKADPNFEIITRESVLTYLSDDNIKFRRKMELRALKNNLTSYEGRYAWSGDKDHSVCSKIKEHSFNYIDKISSYRHYIIDFGKKLKKNEKIQIDIEWKLSNKNNEMYTYLATSIDEPTDKLILKVCFSDMTKNVKAIGELCPYDGADPSSTEDIKIDNDNVAIWNIPKPKLYHFYRLKWILQ